MKLGKAFSDSVSREQTIHMKPVHEGDSWWLGTGRALMFATVLFIALFILLWRLFDLTIIQGHEFRTLADNNRTRELVIHAPRGLLLDRTGRPLVANIPVERQAGPYTETDYRRQYLFDSLSQVTGYVGELSPAELKNEQYQLRGYFSGDHIGRAGAEEVYEDKLRGQDGKKLVEVDSTGKILRTLGVQPAIPGENITLSVDVGLSEAAQKAFPAGEKGAIVVSKPSTGEILALYSSPNYSANDVAAALSEPDQPMLDRAISGTYPPGSTFKIIMGIAALETGVVTPTTTVDDEGTITIGPFSFSNWYWTEYGKMDGVTDIVKAFQRSNDIFFYKVGEWLGITNMATYGRLLGLGKPLGIELPGEATGIMPDPAWKEREFTSPADLAAHNNEWYLGDTYHVAIGQGYLTVTPLQVNAWTNAIASDGKLCRPTILKLQPSLIRGAKGDCKNLGLKPQTIDLVAKGLEEACAPGGTGWPLFDYAVKKTQIPVACKTGTAEFGDPQDRTHAWFTTYAPVPPNDIASESSTLFQSQITGQPEISITVIVEGAGEGSNVAAPVAKQIYDEWFNR